MMRNFVSGITLMVLSVHGAGASTFAASSDALDAGLVDDTRAAGLPAGTAVPPVPATTVRIVAPPAAPTPEQTLSANPLWAIPLTLLSATRERPIFSPSRRPPSAAVAAEPVTIKAPPVRKREPEPPQLALVGTIASDEEGFGIFLDQSTKTPLRLKVGEDYQGWKLRAIEGRQVTLEKDQQAAVLTLPQPGVGQPGGEVRLLPASAVKIPLATRR
jgi:general secretion pathway protein N